MSAAEAEALIEKAEKKLNSFGWFGGNKFEEAGELYTKAGNSFKLAKKCNLRQFVSVNLT